MKANRISRNRDNINRRVNDCREIVKYEIERKKYVEERLKKGKDMGIRQRFEQYFKECIEEKEPSQEMIEAIIKVFVKKYPQFDDEKGIESIKTWANEIIHPETKKTGKKNNIFKITPLPRSEGRKNGDEKE